MRIVARPAEAGEQMRRAKSFAKQFHMPFDEALARRELGRLAAEQSRADDARRHLEEAFVALEKMSAHQESAVAREELARLPGGVIQEHLDGSKGHKGRRGSGTRTHSLMPGFLRGTDLTDHSVASHRGEHSAPGRTRSPSPLGGASGRGSAKHLAVRSISPPANGGDDYTA